MKHTNSFWKRNTQSTLRHWRSTPTYIFLIWRWGTLIFALNWLLTLAKPVPPHVASTISICLVGAFAYTLLVTLYAPVSRVLLAQFARQQGKPAAGPEKSLGRARRRFQRTLPQLPGRDEKVRIFQPLLDTRNRSLNLTIYCFDVLICGLLVYFSSVNGNPPFGIGSPFYRYGLSTVLVAGFTYGYGGGLLAALAYSLFAVLAAFVLPPGQTIAYDYTHLSFDFAGAIIDAPLIALLAAYLASQLNKAILSKRQVQERVQREKALRGVSEMLVTDFHDQVQLLRRSVKAIRQGGHFEKLVIALIRHEKGQEPRPDFDTYVETDLAAESRPDVSEELVSLVTKTGHKHVSFDPLAETLDRSTYGIARLYKPFFHDNQLYLVIGAERTREEPFDQRQEDFLDTVGPQLIVALENVRLTMETAALATLTERGRIAREIHDGVAQLLYMLSLNSETCLALAERAGGTTEPENSALALLKQSLEKQVTISKQALWETRHYMTTLRPLMSGATTLTQLLTTQIHEFEAISGLPARLEIEGEDGMALNGDQQRNQRLMQVGTAIFRIIQEALTNAYKHAQASQLEVRLRYLPGCISVEICDNGTGMMELNNLARDERVYSGRGLRGMRDRAAELDGTIDIRANADGGTCVAASIPL